MAARGTFRGHDAYYDWQAHVWRYADNGMAVPSYPAHERPCAHCGLPPTPAGEDGCLGHIPGVTSACCGHGVEKGYIVWQSMEASDLERVKLIRMLIGAATAVFVGWLLHRAGGNHEGEEETI